MAVLEARRLEGQLGRFRLGPLDLEIGRGEYVVLVGPSGAGKTVLLETLLGWHRPAAGEVRLRGEPVDRIPATRRALAYVPQDLGLLPHLGVRENLTWGLDCRGERPDHELLRRLVGVLDLEWVLDRQRPQTLSRGEQQRVALGRALLTSPDLLMLDEPCAALDLHLRREFQLLLRRLHKERGTTVVHITHDREEAFLLGERIGVLLDGRLHQVASPEEVYDRPADARVARFLAPENLWRGVGEAREGRDAGVRLDQFPSVSLRTGKVIPGTRVHIGIRPEEVMVLHPGRPLRPQVADNVLAGKITELLLLDGRVQVAVATEPGLRVTSRLSLCAARDLDLAPGIKVRISLKRRSLYVLNG